MARLVLLLTAGCWLLARPVHAHPVPKGTHDRIVQVRLTPDAVVVEYRLEVDQWTIVFQDLPAVAEKADLARLSKAEEFYEAFSRTYAPILADNLIATLDDKLLTFDCVRRAHEIVKPDNNLRCDFVFRAPWLLSPGRQQRFAFREGNYELENGQIKLSLAGDSLVGLGDKKEPDEILKGKPAIDLQPGDDAKLRQVGALVVLAGSLRAETSPAPTLPGVQATESRAEVAPSPQASEGGHLLGLLLDSERGFWLLLILAAGFGAAHALTPGHGKTLVAAYLVGERGTVGHAFVLGLVTTLTHTGAVILLAAGLMFLFPRAAPAQLQTILGLGGGLLIAGMGLWLFLRRVSGGADHVHIGGSGQHHHHGGGHVHVHAPQPAGEAVGWWGLIVLGMSGGIVPCWDAVAMLALAVSMQRLWLALPLLVAFSTGLAAVLIAIGIGVVHVKGFASSKLGDGRFIRALPLASAVLVMALGLWLCYDSLHPRIPVSELVPATRP